MRKVQTKPKREHNIISPSKRSSLFTPHFTARTEPSTQPAHPSTEHPHERSRHTTTHKHTTVPRTLQRERRPPGQENPLATRSRMTIQHHPLPSQRMSAHSLMHLSLRRHFHEICWNCNGSRQSGRAEAAQPVAERSLCSEESLCRRPPKRLVEPRT
uniref:Uncharacterized protein n=1 Tax=Rhipicephalus zambeziensis TaxID=60191 RepID=A0A224YBD5_9ACAR